MTSVRSNPTTSAQFAELLSGWNRETAFLSVGNFDNRYFNEIVEMKEAAVPYIYEELKKGPTLLVNALDRIYPGKGEVRWLRSANNRLQRMAKYSL